MNKYKEAFYRLTDWFHAYRDSNGVRVVERHITTEYEEAKETIKELIEKATPKKVIKKYTGYIKNSDDIKFNIYFHYCPNCNVVFAGCDLGCTYCQDCGQALDWKIEVHEDE